MRNLEDTLVVMTGVFMGTAVGVLTMALGLALVGLPWELHLAPHPVVALAVAFTGLTIVVQGVVIVIDLIGERLEPRSAPIPGGTLQAR